MGQPEDISEIKQMAERHVESKIVKAIAAENRMVVSRAWRRGKWGDVGHRVRTSDNFSIAINCKSMLVKIV